MILKRKMKYIIAILVLAFIFFYVGKPQKENKDGRKTEVSVESAEPSVDVELHIDTYEDIRQDEPVKLEENAKENQISDTTNSKDKVSNEDSKVRIIDESDDTMKDETIEKDYNVDEEPQGKIVLTTPGKEEGKEVKDTTKPGGKQNVGTWG